ncbi:MULTISPECIES: ATP-dependent DNA helicase [Brevibacterium]|uniref:DNA 5'-3' helicase n=1 Tax=Brevibacterium salitolerans TaxID=1403566 RepID=A0ABP5IMQ1_9MICO|nr:ATP-dependent DNA helicase [Brevibacterium sp.]
MTQTPELLAAAVAAVGGTERQGQSEMAEAVSSALAGGTHLLVQAGTGTGKSLAYLVPAVDHAVRTGNRVVVSTATLALQAQIVDRDLPRLVRATGSELGRKPAYAVLKGRRNYVCRHKLDGGYPDDAAGMLFDFGADQASARSGAAAGSRMEDEIQRIRSWVRTTQTGDRDDLVPGVSDRTWAQVSVNSFDCLGSKCPVFEECFAEIAKLKAHAADVVVTNHALLAIDAFGDHAVLPEHDAVIVDEAHELRDRVTNALSASLTVSMIEHAASSVRRTGLVQEGVTHLLETAGAAFGRELEKADDGLLQRWPEGLAAAVGQVRDAARQVSADLSSGAKTGETDADTGRQLARARILEVHEVAERMAEGSDNDVAWVTRSTFRERTTVSLVVAPLSVAGTMRSGIFEKATVVATSATLALGGRFDAVAGSLGLAGPEAPRYDAVDVGSPFDYSRQGILYVAAHLPRPGRSGMSSEAVEELEGLLSASDGGALGLFSSKAAAQAAAEEMRARTDLPILLQGEDGLSSLVARFAADERACLFGTLSLWQGVDVPGTTNRLVVIDRIPFPRPDDPLVRARTESAHRAGANGFMSVSAAHAALLMAQGAGRLVRATGDRGVVAVLDERLRNARYSGFLLSSLPPMWRTDDPAAVRAALRRLRGG